MGNIVRGRSEPPQPHRFLEPDDVATVVSPDDEAHQRRSSRKDELRAEMPAFFHEGYEVDVELTDDDLYRAICERRPDEVRRLLMLLWRGGQEVTNASLRCVPYTPLHVACEAGDVRTVSVIKVRGGWGVFVCGGGSNLDFP